MEKWPNPSLKFVEARRTRNRSRVFARSGSFL